MTLASQINGDIDSVFLSTSDFAETVYRLVSGDESNKQQQTAVVTLEPPVIENSSRGRGWLVRGEMILADSVTVTESDAYEIGGDRFEVDRKPHIRHGVTVLSIIRFVPDRKGVRVAGEF